MLILVHNIRHVILRTERNNMLDKSFNPQAVEADISKKWEDKKLFSCHPESNNPGFCIVIPPPNVTGNLHIGHALNNSIQDVLARYKRMKGFDVLWQPGMDHAGIATQMVVERMLGKQGISRHDLGREKFVEKVWEWKQEYGGQILNQLHRLGCSADWDRTRFTMDEGLSRAVRQIFVRMYKDGLIYKDKRLVNWDSKLQTAISDLEVVQKETVGKMWYFKYQVEENPDETIMIGTTRPETLFGDTAVAVSADDERYKHLIGKNVLIPIINKPIPVVADEHADPTKGTGAVKITPAHDFNDFEVGKRHNLPMVNILDRFSKLNENVPEKYRGMTPLEARPLVLDDIKSLGLYDHEEDNPMTIPHGDRSDVIIEPWLTDQWFVDTPKLAVKAIEVIENGESRFIPKNWENGYFEWMRHMQPWCISRQLWWGHRIPVWYAPDGTQFCEMTEEEVSRAAEAHFGHPVELTQDTDVLDTWFSSGLWAFSTLGWPDETPELKKYYPTSVLVTAFDIIPFWVARMLMMSMYVMKQVPFKDIFIHGLVRDEHGQKMSKSKGNGIDPLQMCDKYGTDAVRYALLAQAGHGRDVLVGDATIENARNFITKIWNAVKFCEMNNCHLDASFNPAAIQLTLNKWIITRLAEAVEKIGAAIETYSFNDATGTLYHFIWGTFCDRYLEAIKPIFYGNDVSEQAETRATVAFARDTLLQVIQPFMPFLAETLWAETENRSQMIMETAWPNLNAYCDKTAAQKIDWLFDLISAIRSVRAEVNIPAATKITLKIKGATEAQQGQIQEQAILIQTLARVENFEFTAEALTGVISEVFDGMTLQIPLAGVIDVEAEKARLTKEIENQSAFVERTKAQLANQDFVSKAPEKVVSAKRTSMEEAEKAVEKMRDVLAHLS